jgi:hypothetical protein
VRRNTLKNREMVSEAPVTVPGGVPDTPPGERSAAPRQKATTAAQRKPGAQPGNANRVTHGAYALRRARQAAGIARDRFKRAAERQWRRILVKRGMAKDDLAMVIAGEATFILGTRRRIESQATRRGFFTRDGEVKPSVNKALELSNGLIDRCARLIEQLAAKGSDMPLEGMTFAIKLGCKCPPCACSREDTQLEYGPNPRGASASYTGPVSRQTVDKPEPIAAASAAPARSGPSEGPRSEETESSSVRPPASPNGDPLGLGWIRVGGGRY